MPDHARREELVITQAFLDDLRRCREVQRKATKRNQELTQRLLFLHKARARVEPGPVRFKVSNNQKRALTRKNLVPIMGLEEFERVHDQVNPVPYQRVELILADRSDDFFEDIDY